MYRVIFEHHPKEGQEEKFIAAWQRGSDLIQEYEGAKGTRLFRGIDRPDVLYAMADWESKQARDKAMTEIAKRHDAEVLLTAHEKFVYSHDVLVAAELIAVSEKVKPEA